MFSRLSCIVILYWLAFTATVLAGSSLAESTGPAAVSVTITGLQIDGQAQDLSSAVLNGRQGPLRLSAGNHALTFFFGPTLITDENSMRLRYQLEGLDQQWRETASPGMRFVVRFQNAAQDFLDENEFYVLGISEGWRDSLTNATYWVRHERVTVPPGAVNMVLLLVSGGTVDTLGAVAIDDLSISVVHPPASEEKLWLKDNFEAGHDLDQETGTPEGWQRGGLRRDILRVIRYGDGQTNHALAAVDTHLRSFGEWYRGVPLGREARPGDILDLEWKQAYNVGYGKASKGIYDLVLPGRYVFRVAGLSTPDGKTIAETTLPIYLPQHFWLTSWFIASCSCGGALVVAVLARYVTRRRMRFQMERLEWQRSLERERSRIARDIHDDLGSGLTRISMLSASASDHMTPGAKPAGELDEITQTARELVGAMDEIVWAVNPQHDKLDSLIAYCGKYAQDFFKAAGMVCRLDLALEVPNWTLTSQIRHNLFLAFKEAINNAARHSRAHSAVISAKMESEVFTLAVQDDGQGFDAAALRDDGNGLANMQHRLREIGGQCVIESSPGTGTVVKFVVTKRT